MVVSTSQLPCKNSTKWTAGVIFDRGKCYLDEEVLKLALDAKEKKEGNFWEQVKSSVNAYNKLQKDYETAMIQMEDYVPDKIDNLPIWLLSHSVGGKEGKVTKRCLQREPTC